MLLLSEMQHALSHIKYKDWNFFIVYSDNLDHIYLQLKWSAKNVDTGAIEMASSRKWLLSPHMTKSELVQTCFKAVMTAEEHEVRELFYYKDTAIFGPHIDVEYLLDAANILEFREPVLKQ